MDEGFNHRSPGSGQCASGWVHGRSIASEKSDDWPVARDTPVRITEVLAQRAETGRLPTRAPQGAHFEVPGDRLNALAPDPAAGLTDRVIALMWFSDQVLPGAHASRKWIRRPFQ